jgi:hypothetical protein
MGCTLNDELKQTVGRNAEGKNTPNINGSAASHSYASRKENQKVS